MSQQERIRYLEEQIEHFNREKRAMLEALELAANVTNFQVNLDRIEDPMLIIHETADRVKRILDFKCISFYLVKEDDSDFYQAYKEPESDGPCIEEEVAALIDDKIFPRALSRNKPVVVTSIDTKEKIVLHSLTVSSRIRGIFVGILANGSEEITDQELFLFSIAIIACSNGLESFDLYRSIRDKNEKLKENLQQIEEKEEKYRALFEQAANSIVLLDPETRKPVEFNTNAHRDLGYSREEFKELRLEQLEAGKTEEEIRKLVRDLCQTEQYSYETHHLGKDGETRNILASVRPITLQGKTFLLALFTDITMQKEHEAERLNLEKQLRQSQKMESIGTLAGGIAHDFNNILAIILGYAELSLLDIPTESRIARTNITQLLKAVERAKKLVMQILTFSQQADELQTPIEVNGVVRESLALMRSTLPTTIEMQEQIEKEPLFILGDTTQIHQVIMNLCTNAAHAILHKNGVIKVELKRFRLTEDDPAHIIHANLKTGFYVQISVSDNGVGIESDMLDRVFEPYFTTKKSGEGTGLGLAVVHGIIENYQGFIDIESTPGKGTTVYVNIPEIGSLEDLEADLTRETIIFSKQPDSSG
jgi:PAS domain S-box-containing protein